MFEFYIGEELAATSVDVNALVSAASENGFEFVTEVLGAYLLAHPDGRTALMRVAAPEMSPA